MPTQKTIDTLNLFASQLENLAVEARRIAACVNSDPDMEPSRRLEAVLGLSAHADGLDLAAARLRYETHQRAGRKAAERLLPNF